MEVLACSLFLEKIYLKNLSTVNFQLAAGCNGGNFCKFRNDPSKQHQSGLVSESLIRVRGYLFWISHSNWWSSHQVVAALLVLISSTWERTHTVEWSTFGKNFSNPTPILTKSCDNRQTIGYLSIDSMIHTIQHSIWLRTKWIRFVLLYMSWNIPISCLDRGAMLKKFKIDLSNSFINHSRDLLTTLYLS